MIIRSFVIFSRLLVKFREYIGLSHADEENSTMNEIYKVQTAENVLLSSIKEYISTQRLISSQTQTKFIEFIYELTQPSANATIRLNKWP